MFIEFTFFLRTSNWTCSIFVEFYRIARAGIIYCCPMEKNAVKVRHLPYLHAFKLVKK